MYRATSRISSISTTPGDVGGRRRWAGIGGVRGQSTRGTGGGASAGDSFLFGRNDLATSSTRGGATAVDSFLFGPRDLALGSAGGAAALGLALAFGGGAGGEKALALAFAGGGAGVESSVAGAVDVATVDSGGGAAEVTFAGLGFFAFGSAGSGGSSGGTAGFAFLARGGWAFGSGSWAGSGGSAADLVLFFGGSGGTDISTALYHRCNY